MAHSTITINAVISRRASFYWLMTALVSAIIASILLKAFTPESFYLPLKTTILVPAKVMFMNVVMTQLGVPAEALGLIMGVDALQNFLTPPTNSMSAIASTITVCAREGVLDRDMFYSESEAQV